MFDIADLVAREGFTTRDDFLAAARDPAPIRDIAPHAPSLEGFFFPATYEFPRHPTGQQMVDAMVKRFRQEWADDLGAAAADAAPGTSEQYCDSGFAGGARNAQARRTPARGWSIRQSACAKVPLQCDPTVVYALELAGQYTGTLEARDIPFDSPYNTYRHPGLPPGPIANPGRGFAARGAGSRADRLLYFVANTEGGHFFSKTLAEHNHNVARIPQAAGRRAQRGAAPRLCSANPPAPEHLRRGPMSAHGHETKKQTILEVARGTGRGAIHSGRGRADSRGN